MQIERILAADIRICRVHLCTVWGSEERRGRTTPSTEFLLSLTVLHIFLHPSFFQLRCLSIPPLHPPPSPSLVSSLPLFTFLQIREDLIMKGYHDSNISDTKKKKKKKKECSVSLSGFNYCRQALSRLHQANITTNTFLFKLREQRACSHRDSTCRRLSPQPFLCTFVSIKYVSSLLVSLTRSLSALSDPIPKESNFALTQNSRSKHQSPDFMAFMGIRHSVQSKPRRGILLVRKEGDDSEPVQIFSADSLRLSHALCLCT